jgi:Protein of unknown function (DUF3667)
MDAPNPAAGSEPWRFSREGERLPDHCLDCGALLGGPYCASCGQRNELEHRSLWQLVKDAVGPAVLLEGKLWRTLGTLLFRPGALSEAYVEGKRSRYIRPLRLYFWVSVLFFSALALRPAQWVRIQLDSGDKVSIPFSPALERKLQARLESISGPGNAREQFRTEFVTRLPKAAFFLVPFSALLLRLLWWKRAYVEHLVLALHGHTVLFLCLGVALIPLLPFRVVGVVGPLLWLPLAFHRFYRSPWWVTALKGIPLALLYLVLLSAASLGTLVVTLLVD